MIRSKLNLLKNLIIVANVLFLFVLTSCKPHKIGGPYSPPKIGIQGVKDVVVSPDKDGLHLFALKVKEGYYQTYQAAVKLYYANCITVQAIGETQLSPGTFTSDFDTFYD